jgi:HD-like signal output (HDOD) protein
MSAAAHRFFAQDIVLPNMPGVAMQVMRSFNDDNASINSLADLIGKDPALSAKLLRLANSARYSPLRSVTNLRDATASLGITTVRKLTIATCLTGTFGSITGIDRERFWRHGIATAHYATQLARMCMIDADAAYLGGLMLRTGQLLMLQMDKPGVVELESKLTTVGQRFSLELARWQCSHADVTTELARRWQFPDSIVSGFACATLPLQAQPFSQMGAVLHLAEVLADAMDLAQPPIAAMEAAAPDLVARLRLKTSWLEDKLVNADELNQEALLMTKG